jgi:hypothetical protein
MVLLCISRNVQPLNEVWFLLIKTQLVKKVAHLHRMCLPGHSGNQHILYHRSLNFTFRYIAYIRLSNNSMVCDYWSHIFHWPWNHTLPSRGHYGFHSFRLLTDFVSLYTYEIWLFICKIVRSSVILLLPLATFFTNCVLISKNQTSFRGWTFLDIQRRSEPGH